MKDRLVTALALFAVGFIIVGMVVRQTAEGASLFGDPGAAQRTVGMVLILIGVAFGLAAVFTTIVAGRDPDDRQDPPA